MVVIMDNSRQLEMTQRVTMITLDLKKATRTMIIVQPNRHITTIIINIYQTRTTIPIMHDLQKLKTPTVIIMIKSQMRGILVIMTIDLNGLKLTLVSPSQKTFTRW